MCLASIDVSYFDGTTEKVGSKAERREPLDFNAHTTPQPLSQSASLRESLLLAIQHALEAYTALGQALAHGVPLANNYMEEEANITDQTWQDIYIVPQSEEYASTASFRFTQHLTRGRLLLLLAKWGRFVTMRLSRIGELWKSVVLMFRQRLMTWLLMRNRTVYRL